MNSGGWSSPPRVADEPIISAVGRACSVRAAAALLWRASQHQFAAPEMGAGEVASLRGSIIARHRVRRGRLRDVFVAACPQGLRTSWAALRSRLVLPDGRVYANHGYAACHSPRSGCLTKWFQSTRLVTRTKESDMCASVWVSKTRTRNESDAGWDGLLLPFGRGGACTIDRSG